MPQKGLNPPSRKATADVKGDGAWGSGKDFPEKFFPLPHNPTVSKHNTQSSQSV